MTLSSGRRSQQFFNRFLMLDLDRLKTFLDCWFAGNGGRVNPGNDLESDPNGIYRPSRRPIRRLGMALEPWVDIGAWVQSQNLDALWLHRPWNLPLTDLPPDLGILAYHRLFDRCLTLGFNLRLAAVLGMIDLMEVRTKAGIPPGNGRKNSAPETSGLA